MRSFPIDPRDASGLHDAPEYRVHFWSDDGSSDEWQLVECEVDTAISWAYEHAGGRRYSLFAVVPSSLDQGVDLVRLLGWDGDVPDARNSYPAWSSEVRGPRTS
ncbi:hypothetical protein AA0Z99_06745 [Agrococcus sp. 1P02AA]|uniref:hypothetical protein n=1 Tax=Agrococcus sp. 1P02AA TaxID=3132259 RepID=UPI0039A6FF05